MHLDVLDLRSFYYRTSLGRAAQRAIRDQLRGLWPDVTGKTVAGFGFAVPLLRPYLGEAERTIALMPGQQGVMPWPSGAPNLSVLCHETLWPLETGTVDRLVLMHGLETSENPFEVLEECYRVLAPQGRAVFIVPNRGGLWARRDATPFGFGRPYTRVQLEAQLKSHDFVPERHLAALFQPPSAKRFWMKTGGFWEKMGRKLSNSVAGGVLMVEVVKQVPAPPRRGLPEAVRKPLRVLDGITQPAPKPV
ncbi:MAG: methyltransferase domain-containing protein [Rhodobacteraceae bacterium]|nr:class I SAM-dependent methyltransferase [Alphaproteobacteria bacterium]MBT8474316.1 class I SAM-dependent methyltransferase [Alphaproteobacteria bacterium]NNF72880.1 methyltransferase domain-containing protein [Paracoccaceae bacterium]NNK65859.1 methyltransferase domain-containing protein [Paracoccaceae bacterium]